MALGIDWLLQVERHLLKCKHLVYVSQLFKKLYRISLGCEHFSYIDRRSVIRQQFETSKMLILQHDSIEVGSVFRAPGCGSVWVCPPLKLFSCGANRLWCHALDGH